jgi:poly(hydroxyalkanoate) granule-associated protein
LKPAAAAQAPEATESTSTEVPMARKTKSRTRSDPGSSDSAQAIRDSAQKIWLAGLGAFERARTEGPRMFEALVEQGRSMGARAVGAADEALKSVREANYSGGRWDKLEQVFEERVSRSLGRLGVLTARDVEDLSRQVSELNDTVRKMMASTTRKAAKAGAKKPAAGRSKAASAGARKRKAKRARPA